MSIEPKAVKIGCVDVPSASAIVFAVSPSIPFVRTTCSAAATISSFVNLFFGAMVRAPFQNISLDAHHSMYIKHYTQPEQPCQ